MAPAAHSPWHKEVSALSLFIALPQLITSPIIVGLKTLAHSQNVVFEIGEILDFLATSFPLTLSIALLFVIIERGEFNLGYMLLAVVGAALLSNALHWVIGKTPWIDVSKTLNDSTDYNAGGNAVAFRWVRNLFGVYWEKFGAIIFIQSCCIGIYAGYRYVKFEEKRKKEKQQSEEKK